MFLKQITLAFVYILLVRNVMLLKRVYIRRTLRIGFSSVLTYIYLVIGVKCMVKYVCMSSSNSLRVSVKIGSVTNTGVYVRIADD